MTTDYNVLLSTTDAQAWARTFVETCKKHELDPLDEELLTTWFANAFGTAEITQTAYQAIEHAKSRAHYHQIVGIDGVDSGSHELTIAIHKLEEAQMWFTRGLALIQGKFNPADLESENVTDSSD
jgi:hypothetical protein